MRKAHVMLHGVLAGILEQLDHHHYRFTYQLDYQGPPISLTMPVRKENYDFGQFPPFFDGLLPEGVLLDALLRRYKLDKTDYFGQLITVGQDVVGAVTVEKVE